MERRKYFIWRKQPFWLAVVMQLLILTTATNVTTNLPQVTEASTEELFAWSAWGSWSPCSRTCGGGVSVQERHCLPRSRDYAVVPNTTLDTPTIRVRVTRQTSQDCLGISKRYHECNTAPCATGDRDTRAEQCSSYDRRPFRGRFYTWVPYVDGESPCMLNCRPLGQQFYASLSLAADCTPCTKPGYRAICVQGSCKASICCYCYISWSSESPMLNCHPLDQQFYASLSLAADGTPCTKPRYRAICVQGICKASICCYCYISWPGQSPMLNCHPLGQQF